MQIIGWILATAVLLLILILFIFLFYPARYLVDIHWLDENSAKFHADWLFHMIRAKISYGDDLLYGETYVFGKRKTFSYDFTEEKEPTTVEKEAKEVSDKGIVSKIKGMIERIKIAYPKIKKILSDEKNKEAVNHLKKELLYFFKILLPKKSKIDAVFSVGAPDKTGQIFGVLACMPAMHQKNCKVIPDFTSDDLYFKGTIWGKGRIYGYQIIGIILRIVFDKNCIRLYTIINKFITWLKKSNSAEVKING